MSCKLTVMLSDNKYDIICEENSRLIDILSNNSIHLSAPCGGKCFCGKCKVIVEGDTSCEDAEKPFLSEDEINSGVRLACVKRITQDTVVKIPNIDNAKIAIGGIMRDTKLNPIVTKKALSLDTPRLDNSNHDLDRLLAAAGNYRINIHALQMLGKLSAKNITDITAVIIGDEIVAVEEGDSTDTNFSVAVDIGTTTIVAYLVNLANGTVVGNASTINKQNIFGSDVISRINHTIETGDDTQMQKIVSEQINSLCNELAEKQSIDKSNIYSVMLTGNTVMLHFACGFSTASISKVPFNSVTIAPQILRPSDIGISTGIKLFLPSSFSSYVGADITTAAAACELDKSEKVSLLVDIGTNGEILLGNKHKCVCCATAAGPAFEGAHIEKGIGGVSGAINKFVMDKDAGIHIETINDEPAIGICGSGVLDIVAQLLKYGIIDETGRMLDKSEIPQPFNAFVQGEGIDVRFYITDEIYLSAGDVRELQLAKASIAAGINVLMKEYSATADNIETVYLAGGFGSYMNSDSAVMIGLLPKELQNKITVCGNAAGNGAVSMLLNKDLFYNLPLLNCEYIDLSTNLDFQTEYIDCMMF